MPACARVGAGSPFVRTQGVRDDAADAGERGASRFEQSSRPNLRRIQKEKVLSLPALKTLSPPLSAYRGVERADAAVSFQAAALSPAS